ncbi:MAG: IPTL-CTERM sorting domain-containing protein [Candidatus Kapabacteria bacterium]|nr:IPTL-CTERM sorting domain-containing protein [Candidatus Kapabacteria bacterium]
MIQNKIINLTLSIFLLILIMSLIANSQTKKADVFPAGGGQSENTQYKNFGTFGQPSAGSSANSSYKNKEGFLNSGDEVIPMVSTSNVFNINLDLATSGGEILDNGGAEIISSGIIYSQTANAEIGDLGVTVVYTDPMIEDGTFTLTMSGLVNGETYYVRAFAENEVGYGYGDDVSFVSVPTLGEWGMITLASLLAGFGGWFVWRRVV